MYIKPFLAPSKSPSNAFYYLSFRLSVSLCVSIRNKSLFSYHFYVICAFLKAIYPLKNASKNLVSMLESAYLENLATSHSSDCISCRLERTKKRLLPPPHFPQNTMVWTPILLTRVSWSSECNIKPAALTPCSCCHGDNGRIHSLLFAMLVIRLF